MNKTFHRLVILLIIIVISLGVLRPKCGANIYEDQRRMYGVGMDVDANTCEKGGCDLE